MSDVAYHVRPRYCPMFLRFQLRATVPPPLPASLSGRSGPFDLFTALYLETETLLVPGTEISALLVCVLLRTIWFTTTQDCATPLRVPLRRGQWPGLVTGPQHGQKKEPKDEVVRRRAPESSRPDRDSAPARSSGPSRVEAKSAAQTWAILAGLPLPDAPTVTGSPRVPLDQPLPPGRAREHEQDRRRPFAPSGPPTPTQHLFKLLPRDHHHPPPRCPAELCPYRSPISLCQDGVHFCYP